MEFLTSRVTLLICGAVLIGTVALPFGDLLESDENDAKEDIAHSVASIIDMYRESGLDELTVQGTEILPSPSSYITADGHTVILHADGREYKAATGSVTEGITITFGETTTLFLEDGKVRARRTSRRPSSPQLRTCRCPDGCCKGTPRRGRSRGYRGSRSRSGRSACPNGS